MRDIALAPLAILLYGSGLLVWPLCALFWRKTRRRAHALKWVFFTQLLLLLVLVGFLLFSNGLLEHGYYWLILMIMLNLLFTPLAIMEAMFDYFSTISEDSNKPHDAPEPPPTDAH